MKRILLMCGLTVGVAAGAYAQGRIQVQNSAREGGFNLFSSNPSDANPGDWFTGTVMLEVLYATNSPAIAAAAVTINSDQASIDTQEAAFSLVQSDFTQENWGLTAGTETELQSFAISDGSFTTTPTEIVGTSSDIQSGSTGYYALIAFTSSGLFGCLVLNENAGYNLGGGVFPTSMGSEWPAENMVLLPVSPEPTTTALLGLAGLSLLGLRRRKA